MARTGNGGTRVAAVELSGSGRSKRTTGRDATGFRNQVAALAPAIATVTAAARPIHALEGRVCTAVFDARPVLPGSDSAGVISTRTSVMSRKGVRWLLRPAAFQHNPHARVGCRGQAIPIGL